MSCSSDLTTVYRPTTPKFKLDVECTGFDIDTDDIQVRLFNGKVSVTLEKTDLVIENDDIYFVFASEDFGTGKMYMQVTVVITDPACPDGERTESYITELCKVV